MSNYSSNSALLTRIARALRAYANRFSEWAIFLLPIFYFIHNYNYDSSSLLSFKFLGLICVGEILLVIALKLLNRVLLLISLPISLLLIALDKLHIYQVTNSIILLAFSIYFIIISWKFSIFSFLYVYSDYSLGETYIIFLRSLVFLE